MQTDRQSFLLSVSAPTRILLTYPLESSLWSNRTLIRSQTKGWFLSLSIVITNAYEDLHGVLGDAADDSEGDGSSRWKQSMRGDELMTLLALTLPRRLNFRINSSSASLQSHDFSTSSIYPTHHPPPTRREPKHSCCSRNLYIPFIRNPIPPLRRCYLLRS